MNSNFLNNLKKYIHINIFFLSVLKDYIQSIYKIKLNYLQVENDNFVHLIIKNLNDINEPDSTIRKKVDIIKNTVKNFFFL